MARQDRTTTERNGQNAKIPKTWAEFWGEKNKIKPFYYGEKRGKFPNPAKMVVLRVVPLILLQMG